MLRRAKEEAEKKAREIFGDLNLHFDVVVYTSPHLPFRYPLSGVMRRFSPNYSVIQIDISDEISPTSTIAHEIFEGYGSEILHRNHPIEPQSATGIALKVSELASELEVATIISRRVKLNEDRRPILEEGLDVIPLIPLINLLPTYPLLWLTDQQTLHYLFARIRAECCGNYGWHLFEKDEDIIRGVRDFYLTHCALNILRLTSELLAKRAPDEEMRCIVEDVIFTLIGLGGFDLYGYIKGSEEKLKELLSHPLPSRFDCENLGLLLLSLKTEIMRIPVEEMESFVEEWEKRMAEFFKQARRFSLEELLG